MMHQENSFLRLNFKNNYLIVSRNILPELNSAIFSKQQLSYDFCEFFVRKFMKTAKLNSHENEFFDI